MEAERGDLRKLTNVTVFTALVFVATLVMRVTIPATGGYFNIGDGMIYVAALLYGPFVGALSGGIGAALSDVLGYPIYAPGTFIIKLGEGFIVGYLGSKIRPKTLTVTSWRTLSLFFGLGLGAATYYIGVSYMGVFGNALLDQITWTVVALFLGVFIIFTGFTYGAKTNWQAAAVILGGTEMVVGYFLYENLLAKLFPGLGIFAVGEIPLNIGQMLVGLTIALPVLGAVRIPLPSESKSL